MTERRGALSADEARRRSAEMAERLRQLPELGAARSIAAFLAKPGEIDPAAALDDAQRRGATVVYPRVTAGQPRLRFHLVTDRAQLRPGFHGVLEPDAGCPEVPLSDIQLFVVPGLAFDPHGRRLGYGGGYYDEVGAEVRRRQEGALLVAVGFDFQVVATCPAGEGDVAVDLVVTDERVIRARIDTPR
jgi:5-formyltetrahydrofolate cyclo-ligase